MHKPIGQHPCQGYYLVKANIQHMIQNKVEENSLSANLTDDGTTVLTQESRKTSQENYPFQTST